MHPGTPLMCHCEEAKGAVAISGRQLRFRRGLPVIQRGTARLPRPLWGLAMTNLEAYTFDGAVRNLQVRMALAERRYRRNRRLLF